MTESCGSTQSASL
uniref:Uncharacterized protein n=1 Tax=Arundo donax TaxID=35708 RepID=A0A0A8Z576_ARUDO